MLLESACIPIPSEATMPFAGFAVSQGHMSLLGIVAAGVAGNLVGSWIAYAVGCCGRLAVAAACIHLYSNYRHACRREPAARTADRLLRCKSPDSADSGPTSQTAPTDPKD